MVNDAPRIDAESAQRIARELYRLDAVATPLTSERDQNFVLTTSLGERRVLKIADALEQPDVLDAQQAAMSHVASHAAIVPQPIVNVDGALTATVRGGDGRSHL